MDEQKELQVANCKVKANRKLGIFSDCDMRGGPLCKVCFGELFDPLSQGKSISRRNLKHYYICMPTEKLDNSKLNHNCN